MERVRWKRAKRIPRDKERSREREIEREGGSRSEQEREGGRQLGAIDLQGGPSERLCRACVSTKLAMSFGVVGDLCVNCGPRSTRPGPGTETPLAPREITSERASERASELQLTGSSEHPRTPLRWGLYSRALRAVLKWLREIAEPRVRRPRALLFSAAYPGVGVIIEVIRGHCGRCWYDPFTGTCSTPLN